MTLEARRAGDAIAASAGELARIWRAARAQGWPDVFPGLLDGVVEDFFGRAGAALAEGRDPALVWPATCGVVRLAARADDRGCAVLDAEWDLVEQTLEAACRALDARAPVREWLRRATVIARAGARALPARGGPAGGVAIVWWFSRLAPARRPRRDA